MTADASVPPPPTPYWLKQLRRSSLVVLVAGVSLGTLVAMHDLRLSSAILVFFCIAGVALVPLQSHDGVRAREESGSERLTEGVAVRAVIGAIDALLLLGAIGALWTTTPLRLWPAVVAFGITAAWEWHVGWWTARRGVA